MTSDNNGSIAVLDFETATGDPASACAIGWSIVRSDNKGAWVVLENNGALVRPPGNKYSEETIAVHGITPSMTEASGIFRDVWDSSVRPQLLEAGVKWLCAYNAPFDAPVLWASLQGVGSNGQANELLPYQVIALLRDPSGEVWKIACLMNSLAPKVKGAENKKLVTLCEHVGIDLVAAHDASDDSYAAASLLCMELNKDHQQVPALFDDMYGTWIQFTRDGPSPTERSRLTDRQSSILHGVSNDGRIHRRVLLKERRFTSN